ncbi:hypothetical protein K7432_008649 [Basidiobolus ranarum]|uniref:Protein Asterix n=1 Tax=Basidiobolus ranarum TaxID=34480 RepID=A0ABR2VY81_9FUNG
MKKYSNADPRRPDAVVPFIQPKVSEDAERDAYGLMATVFAMMGIILKHHWGSWWGLIFSMISWANEKQTTKAFRQTYTSMFFSILGLFINYLQTYYLRR